MDRMSPLDASFLHIEDDNSHMHIASVAVFEGPAPAYRELVDMIAGKLPLVPRYRQKVKFVPLNVGRPVWVDDPHFNIEYHVRHTALPAPGAADQLRNLVGRVMSQQLDRSKPLWEVWMIEGLEDGHFALASKTHHAMVDGIAGTDLLAVVLDTEPEPERRSVNDSWEAGDAPSDVRLVADALTDLVVRPYEQIRALRAAARRPRELVGTLRTLVRGFGSAAGVVRASTSGEALNGPIGPHRRWDWARATLADVKAVRAGLGGTVNDVVLAAITRGFRDLLLSRGEIVLGRTVRTMVPVSVRSQGERGTYNNRVSAMFADLPVGIDDAAERLASIRAQMDGLKESQQAVAGEVLTSLSGFAPPMLLALGGRLMSRVNQRNINTVTTNVPGPQFPLYAVGRRMLEAYPFVPIMGSVRIGIAIFSYCGQLNFGITGDWETVPDLHVLANGIEEGVIELCKAAAVAAPHPVG
ncbi:MAG: Acyltransferase [Acidimicrobiales bacterium]|jgi:diacylglycerol O-acyltransferase|nr:Acyltransferase [Acidimicrobiales bacterium]